ncbi:MAG: hypothetical protein LBV26_06810 [Bacteroidales bacterium]|jgi:hypothetical protein|nr:hypothetical protein [Bacteroidales bacterium]
MQLNKFLEKFLPDYGVLLIKEDVNLMDEHRMFNERHFTVALQNFTDRLCEKQRENCASIITERIDDNEAEPFEDGLYVTSCDMFEAEQPNIDQL